MALDRDEAIGAVWLLTELWWDINAGDGLLQILEECRIPVKPGQHTIALHRMVVSHLFMVLCKLVEFHEHYSRHLPEECRLWLKELNAEVARRGIRELRNKQIGHIWDTDMGAPLTPERSETMFMRGVDDDSEGFFRWMRNEVSPDDLSTVMGRVRWLMRRLIDEHALSEAEVQAFGSRRTG